MPNSQRLSHGSETCRLEWRPSRAFVAVQMSLGVLGACSVLASEMPRTAAWLLAAAAMVYAALLSERHLRLGKLPVVWNGRSGTATIDGLATDGASLQWRGPIAFLHWRDGARRRRCLAFWPDALDPKARRELLLAAGPPAASPRGASMAP
jgi:toxin CptA